VPVVDEGVGSDPKKLSQGLRDFFSDGALLQFKHMRGLIESDYLNIVKNGF